MRIWRRLALMVALVCAAPGLVLAQDLGTVQSQILVLDIEGLFNRSKAGQRITRDYQAERERLIASNRRIEADLRAEEQALTEKRPTMTPAAFRDLADAFDAKVRGIRQDNEREALDLERRREVAPLQLMRLAEPVLVQIMRDTGGIVILDHRQVLLRADVIDITDLAISRVDVAIGDGTRPVDGPPPEDGTPDASPDVTPDQLDPETAQPESTEPGTSQD
ncbi:OmpH family outer membrane protein [Roseovarius pelagicus]|uniref:OmpH family outer membrane protein n=1 Tax=Roseovarius pelagicus TaxID=2980108 RepID=A0ABY6DC29_9RHOB|nr:OmpH family outer membrane protein [Roseovarius pelagicus]UXX83717.1 OmpH family outer membrane protein [Roseovarius pelagicus]